MSSLEIEEKSIEDAIKVACETLRLPREMLDIEIISRGSSGIFGIVGAKKAKIRVRPKGLSLDVLTERAKAILEEILKYVNLPTVVDGEPRENYVYLNIISNGSGLLIGKKGQVLDALQYLVARILNRQTGQTVSVVVDTENYRTRREESLKELARELKEKVRKTCKPITTGLMSASERKIIHVELKDDPDVRTKSKGDGLLKRLVVYPVRHGKSENKKNGRKSNHERINRD
ncbi:MAG: RNA-binding cell elongation regulator Jag/EloR [Thermodesulforhabdaceae bacterium]